MTKLEKIKKMVNDLYESQMPARAELADWFYKNHIYLVANEAEALALRFGGDVDMAVAGAILHDIADAVMDRFHPDHEEESLRMARLMLAESGFQHDEIMTIVDDAIRYHSCLSSDESPKTEVGKVLATADALVHLNSDYYPFLAEVKTKTKTPEEVANWLLPKLDRDFNLKIQFSEILDEQKPNYEKKRLEILASKFD